MGRDEREVLRIAEQFETEGIIESVSAPETGISTIPIW